MAANAVPKRRDWWDKVEIFSRIASALVVPVAIFFVGAGINDALKDRELRARYVELAIQILKAPPNGPDQTLDTNLRRWAVQVLDTYAPVPLDPLIKANLLDQTIIRLPTPRQVRVVTVPGAADTPEQLPAPRVNLK